jgi:16S rRNA U1498 N3-methylase RsmE
VSDGREQNWYPTSEIGYFTGIVREGISITVGQIELFAPAVEQPYRLDDATVDHAVRVYENQREDQVLFRNQAARWAGEVVTTEEKAALATYVAALDELNRLTGDVLAMCSTLSGQTIEKLLVKSDLEVGLEALGIPRD